MSCDSFSLVCSFLVASTKLIHTVWCVYRLVMTIVVPVGDVEKPVRDRKSTWSGGVAQY